MKKDVSFEGNLDFFLLYAMTVVNVFIMEFTNSPNITYKSTFSFTLLIFIFDDIANFKKNIKLLFWSSMFILLLSIPILIEIDFSKSSILHFEKENLYLFEKTVLRSLLLIISLIMLADKQDIADFVYILRKMKFNNDFLLLFVISYKTIENLYVIAKEILESQLSRNGYTHFLKSVKSTFLLTQGILRKGTSKIQEMVDAYRSRNIEKMNLLEKNYRISIKPFIYEIIIIFLVVLEKWISRF
ncbi:MAG: CbiQ family ECF transporter T component [Fervidobacterium sp.]